MMGREKCGDVMVRACMVADGTCSHDEIRGLYVYTEGIKLQ